MPTYKAGGDIDTYCNRCKLELAHVIIAMAETRPARVQCKTCRSEHAYKAPAGAKKISAPRTRTTSTTSSSRASARASDYDELMAGKDISRAQRYKVSERFADGDVINHTMFGLGLVLRLLSDGKMEVMFPTGTKVLAHGR